MAKTKALKKAGEKNQTDIMADQIVFALQEIKGKEIVCLDLRPLKSVVADMFIICHADSTTQVSALARSVEEVLYKNGQGDPQFKEGQDNAQWILLDYINIVVHIFQKEYRDYYGIEKLWADATVHTIKE